MLGLYATNNRIVMTRDRVNKAQEHVHGTGTVLLEKDLKQYVVYGSYDSRI
jgi:hypothetical protein